MLVLAVILMRIESMGMIGMAYATLCQRAIVGCVIFPYLACRRLGQSIFAYWGNVIVPSVATLFPAVCVGVALKQWMGLESYFQMAILGSSVGIVAAAVGYFVCLERQLRSDIWGSLAPKLKKA